MIDVMHWSAAGQFIVNYYVLLNVKRSLYYVLLNFFYIILFNFVFFIRFKWVHKKCSGIKGSLSKVAKAKVTVLPLVDFSLLPIQALTYSSTDRLR